MPCQNMVRITDGNAVASLGEEGHLIVLDESQLQKDVVEHSVVAVEYPPPHESDEDARASPRG